MLNHEFFQKFFAGKIEDKETLEAIKRMTQQIEEKGGLTFSVTSDENGWFAKCLQFPGIMSGGDEVNPTEELIAKSLLDSVHTAFHVPIMPLEEKIESKLKFKVTKQERLLQLCQV